MYDYNSHRRAVAAYDKAREAHEQFAEAMAALGTEVKDIDPPMFARVDAYPGWTADRDVGGGQSMDKWLDEIGDRLGVTDDEDDLAGNEQYGADGPAGL